MLSIRLFVITAFGLVVAVAAQLSSQCQFVRFSPGFDSEDPISYTARCARVPDGPVEVCSELRLGHCFTNQDGSLGGAVDGNAESFTNSCPSCNVDSSGKTMFCVCERMSKSYVYTSVNLGDYITVHDGLLACTATSARQISECPVSWMGGPPRRRRFVG
ncbi:CVNH domain-containing protein [Purpureocillium lilacinum]|uniref:CVNH domain-containing protein n=1 Tax=Purpureocillium lilacinum TaxID=33203 RepID=A0A179GRR8_PURLI|nr:CVNH domain-containing protein [Purpureocillium lilacinum]